MSFFCLLFGPGFVSKSAGFPLYAKYSFHSFPTTPRQSLFFGGNFAFGYAEAFETVPHSDLFPYVFTGEELLDAARFWTHGYDLYSPLTSTVFHLTSRSYRPTYWEQFFKKTGAKVNEKTRMERKAIEQDSYQRLKTILYYDLQNSTTSELLGTDRSLQDYYTFAGIDPSKQTFNQRAKLGISPNALNEEWIERYGVTKDKWSIALSTLKPTN